MEFKTINIIIKNIVKKIYSMFNSNLTNCERLKKYKVNHGKSESQIPK